MPCIGLDLGSKTIGVSVSDNLGIIASPLEVIRYESKEEALTKLKNIIETKKVDKIVLGNPLNLDGTMSKRSELSYEFKDILEREFNMEVILQDERLSTVEAQNILISNGERRNKRKKVIDKMAATIILQSYLDRSRNGK